MKTLLIVNASPNQQQSSSRQLAEHYRQQWLQQHPQGEVIERDLATTALTALDQAIINAFYTPADQRDEQAQRLIATSDHLVAELERADEVVIATPMHNFSVTGSLKLWIDLICRVGVTFRYGDNGPEGLLTDTKATLILSRGGRYSPGSYGESMNFQDPMLTQVLAFVGITEVQQVVAEGMAGSQEGMAIAQQQIDKLFS